MRNMTFGLDEVKQSLLGRVTRTDHESVFADVQLKSVSETKNPFQKSNTIGRTST